MRIVFIGTGDIGLPALKFLRETREHELVGVVTQPDKPVGRAQRIEAPPIKTALQDSKLPILQPERIKREEAVTAIRALEPEIIVVMAYGQILPRAVLEIPRVACLNLHASLLPRHRGAAPIQAAIAAGDSATGITVMYMDEGLDTGDMLLQFRIEIGLRETGGELHERLAQIAPQALADALEQLKAGDAPRIPQNSADATYAPKLERENGQIDWKEKADTLARKIRAFDPWPGSFTILREESGMARKLKIFRAEASNRRAPGPGVIDREDNALIIGTGEGALEIQSVQLEGKKRMAADDFLRGHPWVRQASAS